MTVEAVKTQTQTPSIKPRSGIFSGKSGRLLRENLTAYLFLSPALLIVFLFGIFPILFASYVSLYKWRIKQNTWRGLDNYIAAMGDPAYLFFYLLAIALVVVAAMSLFTAVQAAREKLLPWYMPLFSLFPGALIAYGTLQILLRAITFFAWEEAIEAGEAARLGDVPLGFGYIFVGSVLSILLQRQLHQRLAPQRRSIPNFTVSAIIVVSTLGMAIALNDFTQATLQASERFGVATIRIRYLSFAVAAMAIGTVFMWQRGEESEEIIGRKNFYAILAIAAALCTGYIAYLLITTGYTTGYVVAALIPLAIGYFIWTWGSHQASDWRLALAILAATVFIAGGVWLATVWPIVSKDSDPEFYRSLSVTVWYSLLTVPAQLGLSMLLAYLLYQNIRAKGLLRIIFFVPYIAPSVATAGIFQSLFNLRDTSIANQVLALMGGEPSKWLKESGSAVATFAESFGVSGLTEVTSGPSMALFVIILYNIWVYVGYDTVIFLAGLGNIPNTLYEAARIDGASRWQIFRHITFPLLSPTTYFLSVISVIGTFKAFNHIFILRDPGAQGTVDAASVHFFVTFQRAQRFGYSTSMAIVLFVIILILYLIQNRIAARSVHYA